MYVVEQKRIVGTVGGTPVRSFSEAAKSQTPVACVRSDSSSFHDEEDVCQRQILRVGEGQERRGASHRAQPARRAAVKLQLRGPAAPDDFHVPPEHALRMSRAERFHGRFLRGEPGGKMGSGASAVPAIGDLAVCKHPLQEAVAEPFDGLFDPWDLGGIEAGADDLHLFDCN